MLLPLTMEIKIKRLYDDAVLPTRAHVDDAGYDLYAHSKAFDDDGNIVYGTGVAMEIPEGYVGLVFPRSSNAKKDLLLSNSVGVIDSGYRGEVSFKFKTTSVWHNPLRVWWECYVRRRKKINVGRPIYITNRTYDVRDRIGQIIIMPYPDVTFVETDELSETDRGTGGYGSSGK